MGTHAPPVPTSKHLDQSPAKRLEDRGFQFRRQALTVDLVHIRHISRIDIDVLGAFERRELVALDVAAQHVFRDACRARDAK
jgi:hypothetical protein